MREYIEAHGYELLILTSHGFDSRPKFIMWVEIGPTGVHDNPMAVQASIFLPDRLIKKFFGLGDHAFHGYYGICVPYTHLQMIGVNKVARDAFNSAFKVC